MGNCHPCKMDATQVVKYRQKKNDKARKRDDRKSKRSKRSKNHPAQYGDSVIIK